MKVPLHPQASYYLQEGLFFKINSFEDLENRIEALETSKERGDAFEVFVEACLATQRFYQAKEVWPGNTIARKKGLLSQTQLEQLDTLSFDWDPINTHWEEMYQALKKYKEKYGHCNVPQRSDDYPDLATWVRTQRIAMREKRPSLLGNRKERLEELGFTWAVYEKEPWDEMLEKLKAYKSKYGDCNVPQKWKENRKLGRWVNTQRLRRLQGRIKHERLKRLNSIGFVWNTKGGKTDEQGELEF